jgi:hypothetical protein
VSQLEFRKVIFNSLLRFGKPQKSSEFWTESGIKTLPILSYSSRIIQESVDGPLLIYETAFMVEAIRQILIGIGSIVLAPAGQLPRAEARITLPPENATSAIAYDFSKVAGDLHRSIDKIEHAEQLPLI